MDPQIDLSQLSDSDKKELNQLITNEAQKSSIQQSKLSLNLGQDSPKMLLPSFAHCYNAYIDTPVLPCLLTGLRRRPPSR